MSSSVFKKFWFKVNIWCGIRGNQLIGPCLINNTMDGPHYNFFLMYRLPLLLSPEMRRRQWFMQDGAPGHVTNANINRLRTLFRNRLISLKTQHIWPPHSPDLNVFDFTIWKFLKNHVRKEEWNDPEELYEVIREKSLLIAPEMIENSQINFLERIRLIIEHDGNLIEQFL